MISAENAKYQALKSLEKLISKDVDELLSLIRHEISEEIMNKGNFYIELNISKYHEESVQTVAEHLRKFGWKTGVRVEYTPPPEDSISYLKVSCEHIKLDKSK